MHDIKLITRWATALFYARFPSQRASDGLVQVNWPTWRDVIDVMCKRVCVLELRSFWNTCFCLLFISLSTHSFASDWIKTRDLIYQVTLWFDLLRASAHQNIIMEKPGAVFSDVFISLPSETHEKHPVITTVIEATVAFRGYEILTHCML